MPPISLPHKGFPDASAASVMSQLVAAPWTPVGNPHGSWVPRMATSGLSA